MPPELLMTFQDMASAPEALVVGTDGMEPPTLGVVVGTGLADDVEENFFEKVLREGDEAEGLAAGDAGEAAGGIMLESLFLCSSTDVCNKRIRSIVVFATTNKSIIC